MPLDMYVEGFFFNYCFKKILIYLAVPGLICDMRAF